MTKLPPRCPDVDQAGWSLWLIAVPIGIAWGCAWIIEWWVKP